MAAEEIQEKGRRGLIEAQIFLDRIFGPGISLPFNAYDHPEKLKFDDPVSPSAHFSFDLRGIFSRTDATTVSGNKTVELLVEVKNYAAGSHLRGEYAEFLRRAAIVGSMALHGDSWFMFLSSVPFGTTVGVGLCDGGFLTLCSSRWSDKIRAPKDLHERTALLFANASLKRALGMWGRRYD